VTENCFPDKPDGSFQCSDDGLNRVYEAARRTTRFVTLECVMDSAERERNAMIGPDAYWPLKSLFPMFGDTSVLRRTIQSGADRVDDPERTRSGDRGDGANRLPDAPLLFL
jgi:hypothetical protein